MLKKLLLLSLLISFNSLFSQHTITGQMKPVKKYSWLILYKLDGVNQKYVNNGTIENGKFTIEIPKDTKPGMYRLLYDNNNNKYIDFIYNDEDVTLEFHPDYPSELVKYSKSDENILFQNFIDKTSTLQNKLDSIQVVYFKTKDASHEKTLNTLYKSELSNLENTQKAFVTASKGKVAQHFIKANKRFYSATLIKKTATYLNTIKTHYFDHVDFNNAILKKSSLLIDRVMDFVFYLNTSKDKTTLVKLRKEAVDISLSKITLPSFKKDIIESLLYTFAQQEDMVMTNYIFKNHFSKLPISLQDYEFKQLIKDMLKTTVGNQAPDIVWKDNNNKSKNLYNLKDSKYYLVVFWSTTCGHCLKEMPLLQKYLEDKPDVQVVAVALENKTSKVKWIDEKYYYETFIHALALSSEDNIYQSGPVKDYGVNSTPNFFLLDNSKKIIGKPYDVKELKKMYPALTKEKPEKK